MSRQPKSTERPAEPVVESATDLVARLVNRRTGFLLHLSETEKAMLRAAAGGQPLAAWIRETCLEIASQKQR